MRAERTALLIVSTLLVVVSLALVWTLGKERLLDLGDDTYAIAASLLGTEDDPQSAWPPVAGSLEDELDRALDAGVGAVDASLAVDASIDAGPPLPPPVDELGYRVRQGSQDGLYYLEVVIGDADFDDPLPMLVMIHGRGSSAQIPGGPFLGLSHPVRIIVPQAPDRLGSGWEWLPVYVGQGLVDRLSSTLFQTASRLAAMLRTLSRERPTVGRLIVSGFSQGGLLALTLALYHDDLVGNAFPLSSWLPPPLEPPYRRNDLLYPRIRAMHGADDTVIPIGPTRSLFSRLFDRGFDVELVEFPGVGHTMTSDENALFHRWLEAAVCRTVGDEVGAILADIEALRLLERDVPDAGYPDDVPRFDASLDAGPLLEAGSRRPDARGALTLLAPEEHEEPPLSTEELAASPPTATEPDREPSLPPVAPREGDEPIEPARGGEPDDPPAIAAPGPSVEPIDPRRGEEGPPNGPS